MQKYKLGLVDPPWTYDNAQQNDPARGGIIYPTLTMEELYNIPLGSAFEDNSILVVWVTTPKLIDSFYVGKEKVGGSKQGHSPLSIINQWGFRPVTALFAWIKTNKRGLAIYEDTNLEEYDEYYSGLGRYTNSNIELAIVARRGKGLPRLDKTVKQLIIAPIGAHSAKPQEQYSRLHRLYGDVPRIELFARKENPPPVGWDATGLDYDGIDVREWIHAYTTKS